MSRESLLYLLRLSLLSWKSYGIGKIFNSCVKLHKIEKYFVFFAGISILVRYVSLGLYGITSAGGFASVGLLLRLDRNAGHRVPITRIAPAHFSSHSYLRLSNTFANMTEVTCFNKITNSD